MPLDLSRLTKIEAIPNPQTAAGLNPDVTVALIVRLVSGAQPPSYATVRTRVSEELYTLDVFGRDLVKLDTDPTVVTWSLPRPIGPVGLSD